MKKNAVRFNTWMVQHIQPGVIISTLVSFLMFRFAASFQDNVVERFVFSEDNVKILNDNGIFLGKFARDVVTMSVTCLIVFVAGQFVFKGRALTHSSMNVKL